MMHLNVYSIHPRIFALANVQNRTGVGFEEMAIARGVMIGNEEVGRSCVVEVNPDHDSGLKMVKASTENIIKMLGERCRSRIREDEVQ